jgi:hypothetical protein
LLESIGRVLIRCLSGEEISPSPMETTFQWPTEGGSDAETKTDRTECIINSAGDRVRLSAREAESLDAVARVPDER